MNRFVLIMAGCSLGACAVQSGSLHEDTRDPLPERSKDTSPRDVDVDESACRAEPGPTPVERVCHLWKCGIREGGEPAQWDGDASTCSVGRTDFAASERALRLVNLHRALAGLPPVELEPAWTSAAQECALLAHANESLSHEPPRGWRCWSPLAANTSRVSLLANKSSPPSIVAYMEDPGNETTMVHRRWLISDKLFTIGVGSTSRFSCLVVDGRGLEVHGGADRGYRGRARPDGHHPSRPWVAWPPAGPVPFDVFERERLDETGWTVQSSSEALETSTVRVVSRGKPMPVKVTHLAPLLGSRSAVAFIPDGWKTAAGETYEVHVEGPQPFEFTVEPTACP